MANITADELIAIIKGTPSLQAALEGRDMESHSVTNHTGTNMVAGLNYRCSIGADPIEAFIALEKESLTNPESTPAVRAKGRIILDEVRAELAKRGIEVPARNDDAWQAKTTQFSKQESYKRGTGYSREGD